MKNLIFLLLIMMFFSCESSVSKNEIQLQLETIKNSTELSPDLPPHVLERIENKINLPNEPFIEVEKFILLIVSLNDDKLSDDKIEELDLQLDKLMESSSLIEGEEQALFMDFIMPLQEFKNQLLMAKEKEDVIIKKNNIKKYLGSFYLLYKVQNLD
ncbi:MAG: hypothetical protein ABF294_02660 [Flavobacteriales bacterium]|jgi:hypothetical protein|nr:hypothetical protein [Flavobacteriales bacterium]|tara:strand:- start:492 stop:962 length:471 start_codon:yes stop_codon:yes gene_type:complete